LRGSLTSAGGASTCARPLSHINGLKFQVAYLVSMNPSTAHYLIAIVEDDAAVLDSLQFALTADGYAVCGFESAEQALRSPAIASADCLVIDYALPGIDGAELVHELRGRGVVSPAIIIASSPTALCRRRVAAAGAPLVEKPLIGESLFLHLQAALEPASFA
jgi:FixJ family two-component response regulator